LFAAAAISYILRTNVSLSGPVLMLDLSLSEQQLGYVFAAFTAGYAIFQFPGGLFADWAGPRRALAIIATLWGLLTILTVTVPGSTAGGVGLTLVALIAVRFLVGVTHAPVFPLGVTVIERWFPVGRWALPNAITSVGLTLGAAAAAAVLPAMIVTWGWRWAFLATAPLGFVIAAAWRWYARDSAREHRSANAAEIALIEAKRPPVAHAENSQPAWLRLLRNRNVLLLTLAYFCSNYIFYLFFSWVPYYLQTVRGFDAAAAGVILAAQWVAGGAGALAGGFLCDALVHRYGLRLGCALPAVFGILVAGLLLVVGAASLDPGIAAWALAGTFFFQQLTEGAFGAATIGVARHHAGGAFGVVNTGGNLVGSAGALIVPFTAGILGWPVAMMTGAVFAVLCTVFWLFIRADQPMPD
jgi:ACS family glucarate transporter-like MFS transporter